MRRKRLYIIFGILMALTLIAFASSAIFSVKTVEGYCNIKLDDETLDRRVSDAASFVKGVSIFSVNESEIAQKVESEVPGIKVVNIERMFPNRISVNYVRLYEYFELYLDGKYYTMSIDGKVVNESDASGGQGKVIKLIFEPQVEPEIGAMIVPPQATAIIRTMERLDYKKTDAASIISHINFTYSKSYIYVKTVKGVTIRLKTNDNLEDLGEMLRLGLTTYVNGLSEEKRTKGMLIVTNKETIGYTANPEPKDAYDYKE